ncbi:hypothetical protein C8N33_10947 [Pararhodobacter aggregans]|nr:hypothetical protein C8N33_10947 [Pararhodobacter aggregans]
MTPPDPKDLLTLLRGELIARCPKPKAKPQGETTP